MATIRENLNSVCGAFFALSVLAAALPSYGKLIEKDADGSTHVNVPFVHVSVDKSDPSGKRVRVRAPFTKVDNPAGPNNAKVRAPFTKVHENVTGKTDVQAPFTKIHDEPNKTGAKIDASNRGTASKASPAAKPNQ